MYAKYLGAANDDEHSNSAGNQDHDCIHYWRTPHTPVVSELALSRLLYVLQPYRDLSQIIWVRRRWVVAGSRSLAWTLRLHACCRCSHNIIRARLVEHEHDTPNHIFMNAWLMTIWLYRSIPLYATTSIYLTKLAVAVIIIIIIIIIISSHIYTRDSVYYTYNS